MKTTFNLLALTFLLVIDPSLCFAEMGIEQVSRERAKQLDMEVRLKAAGSDSVTVELAFKTEGELKSFSQVSLEIKDGAKVLVSSSLHEERSSSGRVAVSFSADRKILDKLTLRVVVSDPRLGGAGYDLRVRDFIEPKKTSNSGAPLPNQPANARLYRREVNQKNAGGKDLIMTFEELRRDERTSTAKFKIVSGGSVGSAMLVTRGFYDIAKARGAAYFIKLREWEDEDGARMGLVGFSQDENINPQEYFGLKEPLPKDGEHRFFAVKHYEPIFRDEP
jgi:hypothetical protein